MAKAYRRFKNKYPVNRGLDKSQQDNQKDVGCNYLTGPVHVKKESKPLCNQDGKSLELCEIGDFQEIPPKNRCRRCERLLGIAKCPDALELLSENQRRLLAEISHRTKGPDQWCFVAALCDNKTNAGWTSLHRSIRRLQRRGCIEKKLNAHNRALVRLTDRHSERWTGSGPKENPTLHLTHYRPPADR